ncbi:hypothetical protein [Hathewaya limosa]|uniref:Tellurite resistance protein n=1 Tax=Hathewaya limosa TaxID=1536 RepID=A0ABU0JT38_HATLI|nr:hypothetical protein [Hathewaya limosa]MDQ0480262.1 tellurite resistance protein [Hathewaya limosa]
MYLAILNSEEKELFLSLAHGLALAEGDFGDEEKATIEGYCREMNISPIKKENIKSLEETIKSLGEISDERIKKIIIFEAIGLAMADNNYDDNERKIVVNMEKVFKLNKGFANDCEMILNEYISFQNRINYLILD